MIRVIQSIEKIDKRIRSVSLGDFFGRPEWKDQKSLTLHITIADEQATLTYHQADEVMQEVSQVLHSLETQIR